jgi:hypothetical protein
MTQAQLPTDRYQPFVRFRQCHRSRHNGSDYKEGHCQPTATTTVYRQM